MPYSIIVNVHIIKPVFGCLFSFCSHFVFVIRVIHMPQAYIIYQRKVLSSCTIYGPAIVIVKKCYLGVKNNEKPTAQAATLFWSPPRNSRWPTLATLFKCMFGSQGAQLWILGQTLSAMVTPNFFYH